LQTQLGWHGPVAELVDPYSPTVFYLRRVVSKVPDVLAEPATMLDFVPSALLVPGVQAGVWPTSAFCWSCSSPL